MKSGKKVSLIMQILIAMVLGVIVGVIWGKGASCIQFIGTVWLNIIKMFIVPVVICMVVRGVSVFLPRLFSNLVSALYLKQ